jgi:hypothetical protein
MYTRIICFYHTYLSRKLNERTENHGLTPFDFVPVSVVTFGRLLVRNFLVWFLQSSESSSDFDLLYGRYLKSVITPEDRWNCSTLSSMVLIDQWTCI